MILYFTKILLFDNKIELSTVSYVFIIGNIIFTAGLPKEIILLV